MGNSLTKLLYENEEFIDEIIDYFPIVLVMNSQDAFDEYIMDLLKVVKDNYMLGNYQVAYFNSHLLLMCYVYQSIEIILKYRPNRCADIYSAIKAYNRREKPKLDSYLSIYEFSTIAEKDIFAVFRAVDMDESSISNLAKYVDDRNEYAHAAGKRDILKSEEFEYKFENIKKIISNIQSHINNFIIMAYIKILIDGISNNKDVYLENINKFIEEYNISRNNLAMLTRVGLSKYRNNNPFFTNNYHIIKSYHHIFLTLCEEKYGIEVEQTDSYLLLKYNNCAAQYIDNFLKTKYDYILSNGEYPLFYCPSCHVDGDSKQLVHDVNNNRFLCFHCGKIFIQEKIKFCQQCKELYLNVENDNVLCPVCKNTSL